ncbi:hypothetical protein C8F04DRAFT_1247106 [Mycena alexandri]|uniref:Cytochrome c oxidase subunit 8, mitochondrial n=1 Tax=Mycena alexandri TaxID=1745969 RepID=A0AAD6TK51_9AGAR|nr:hypothetical protein C8F04DRAFT_1247106 [Mycena alexandri]
MLRLARVPAPAFRQLHTTAHLRSGHGPYNHLPFTAPFQGAPSVPFAVKMFVTLTVGFSIPFVAVKIQHMKREA